MSVRRVWPRRLDLIRALDSADSTTVRATSLRSNYSAQRMTPGQDDAAMIDHLR